MYKKYFLGVEKIYLGEFAGLGTLGCSIIGYSWFELEQLPLVYNFGSHLLFCIYHFGFAQSAARKKS